MMMAMRSVRIQVKKKSIAAEFEFLFNYRIHIYKNQ